MTVAQEAVILAAIIGMLRHDTRSEVRDSSHLQTPDMLIGGRPIRRLKQPMCCLPNCHLIGPAYPTVQVLADSPVGFDELAEEVTDDHRDFEGQTELALNELIAKPETAHFCTMPVRGALYLALIASRETLI